ncbi:hypothetical protein ACFWG7_05860 [Streptomyces koyangensis]|nr:MULTISPECIES: hypothetical protein [Streptomyces]WTD07505.1 hypothetical protein OH717_32255 [Streptomyces albidoflavus]
MAALQENVPAAFWADLRAAGLVSAAAPRWRATAPANCTTLTAR